MHEILRITQTLIVLNDVILVKALLCASFKTAGIRWQEKVKKKVITKVHY